MYIYIYTFIIYIYTYHKNHHKNSILYFQTPNVLNLSSAAGFLHTDPVGPGPTGQRATVTTQTPKFIFVQHTALNIQPTIHIVI